MVIQQQLFTLKTTISQLRNAYNGNDVDWPDQGMLRANSWVIQIYVQFFIIFRGQLL